MCEYHTALDDSDLNHQKCLQFAPLDFCYGVGRKAIHPCTGFCGVMALLIALSYEEGNRLCMSCFFHSKKKKFIFYAEIITSLCQQACFSHFYDRIALNF